MKKLATNYNGNRIVVAFHIGRGGQFNNPGHITFNGEKTFQQLISEKSDYLYIKERDWLGRFCKPFYTDCAGNTVVEPEYMNSEIGILEWDGTYNTDYTRYLDECDEDELRIISKSNDFVSHEAREYIIEHFKDDEDMIEYLSHLYGWSVPEEYLPQVTE